MSRVSLVTRMQIKANQTIAARIAVLAAGKYRFDWRVPRSL
jgi:hypothetical protein